MKMFLSSLCTILQLLHLAAGMERGPRAPPLTPVGVATDLAASHIMRAEQHHSPLDGADAPKHRSQMAVQMLDSGAMHFVNKRKADSQKHAAGHSPRHTRHAKSKSSHKRKEVPAASLAYKEHKGYFNPLKVAEDFVHDEIHGSPQQGKPQLDNEGDVHDGFQERDDLMTAAKDRGYEWKRNHDARDDTNDDDWDDEDSKGTVQDPLDDDGDGDGDFFGDGDGGDGSHSNTTDGMYGDDSSAYDGSDMPIVNVTAEEDATAPDNSGPLKAVEVNPPRSPPAETEVEKLGEGIGAMAYERSPTGSRVVNHDLRQRLQLQDLATIVLLLSVFALTILLSCLSVYQVADDPSPAAYYSEPKSYQQRVICESNDVDAFLAAFNTQPQNVRLRITGKNPEPGGFRRFLRTLNAHTSRPRGLAALLPMRQRRRQAVLFDVALDLSPFITGDGRLSDENLLILQKYLSTSNRLETVQLIKKVDWALWEDVATNIRQRLRTLGFPGDVEVRFEAEDEVMVYQNHKWSNFIRNRVTQALVLISIVGSAFWIPYVWARSKTTKVETRFRINVDPSRYWELVSEGLNAAEGFQSI